MQWGWVMVCVTAAGLAAAGCGPRAADGGFESDNPAARLYAIEQAGETRDRTAIPQLVAQLDSDDATIRLWSIHALERITGERLGYNPYVDAASRRPAVEAWEQAVKDQRFARPDAGATAAP